MQVIAKQNLLFFILFQIFIFKISKNNDAKLTIFFVFLQINIFRIFVLWIQIQRKI